MRLLAEERTTLVLVAGLAKAYGERRLDEKLRGRSQSCSSCDESRLSATGTRAAHLFFQLVSWRYETGAMLITSNRRVAE
jgi:hypothetical protein